MKNILRNIVLWLNNYYLLALQGTGQETKLIVGMWLYSPLKLVKYEMIKRTMMRSIMLIIKITTGVRKGIDIYPNTPSVS
jgi:hypothetical protein